MRFLIVSVANGRLEKKKKQTFLKPRSKCANRFIVIILNIYIYIRIYLYMHAHYLETRLHWTFEPCLPFNNLPLKMSKTVKSLVTAPVMFCCSGTTSRQNCFLGAQDFGNTIDKDHRKTLFRASTKADQVFFIFQRIFFNPTDVPT